jgi:hypothetical protein
MLYVGHFSFSEHAIADKSADGTPWHGIFTCIAEAANVHAALDKFKTLIRDLRGHEDLFDGVEEVFLDACIEITSVPECGMLAHFTLREGEDTGGISTALRGVPEQHAIAYQLGDEDDESDAENDHDIEPFVIFDEEESARRGSTA